MASFLDFLRTGRFAGVGVGDTAAQVAARWGLPTDPGFKESGAWRHAFIELWFTRKLQRSFASSRDYFTTPLAWSDRIELMSFALCNVNDYPEAALPAKLQLDGWPRERVSESHVLRQLHMTKIPWIAVEVIGGEGEPDYWLPSGVGLYFFSPRRPQEERELDAVSISNSSPFLHISARSNLTTPQTKRRVKAFLRKHHVSRIPK